MYKIFISACISTCIFFNSMTLSASENATFDKYIEAPGAEIFCRTMGSGNPLIVIHGMAGFLTHDYLLPHMQPLAENHLVIFYDQRGGGRSTGEITPENINLKTYVADIEAIRLSLGTDKISLLGHSWGAFLALHYAFSHPEAVDKIILMDSMTVSTTGMGLFFAELTKRLAPYRQQLNEIESSELYLAGDPQTVENQLKMTYQVYMHCPENVNKLNLWKSQNAVLNGFKIWDIFKETIFMKPYDLTLQLNQLQCPTLIIHGDDDPIPFVTAEQLQQAIPSSQLIKIEQCGHFPFVEQPAQTFKAIHDFLN